MNNDEMKKLVHVVQELSLARSLEAIMVIVRHAARELTGADGATFILREGAECFYADEDAISPLWKGQRFPMQACISGWSILNRQTVAIEDIYADPRIPAEAYRPTFVKSLIMVPIRTHDPIGAIGTYWAEMHRSSKDEVELLAALADTVSVAIENVQLNTALEQRIQQLEDVNRVKDEFLMTISHELRTPLNGIFGWAELLSSNKVNTSDSALGVETILRNSEALTRLIDDLLDTSLLITGRLHFEKKPVDPIDIIKLAIASVALAADAKRITITIEIKNIVGTILGDPGRLQQVLWNLLTNAIKFTPHGGIVTISLERDNGAAKITVKDNGEGIEPEILPYIFGRFQQANSSSSRKHGGLGLGLALVLHLVEAHGGKVIAESEGPGRGSCFTVYLPLAAIGLPRSPHPAQPHANGEEAEASLSGLRVLVVDDMPDARILASFILKSHDALVEDAPDASKVLDIIDQFQPDLLLCDLGMPGEDGYSLMRRIRATGRDRSTRLHAIAVTAYADQQSRNAAFDAGFDAILSKPLHPKKLIDQILEICKQSSPNQRMGNGSNFRFD